MTCDSSMASKSSRRSLKQKDKRNIATCPLPRGLICCYHLLDFTHCMSSWKFQCIQAYMIIVPSATISNQIIGRFECPDRQKTASFNISCKRGSRMHSELQRSNEAKRVMAAMRLEVPHRSRHEAWKITKCKA